MFTTANGITTAKLRMGDKPFTVTPRVYIGNSNTETPHTQTQMVWTKDSSPAKLFTVKGDSEQNHPDPSGDYSYGLNGIVTPYTLSDTIIPDSGLLTVTYTGDDGTVINGSMIVDIEEAGDMAFSTPRKVDIGGTQVITASVTGLKTAPTDVTWTWTRNTSAPATYTGEVTASANNVAGPTFTGVTIGHDKWDVTYNAKLDGNPVVVTGSVIIEVTAIGEVTFNWLGGFATGQPVAVPNTENTFTFTTAMGQINPTVSVTLKNSAGTEVPANGGSPTVNWSIQNFNSTTSPFNLNVAGADTATGPAVTIIPIRPGVATIQIAETTGSLNGLQGWLTVTVNEAGSIIFYDDALGRISNNTLRMTTGSAPSTPKLTITRADGAVIDPNSVNQEFITWTAGTTNPTDFLTVATDVLPDQKFGPRGTITPGTVANDVTGRGFVNVNYNDKNLMPFDGRLNVIIANGTNGFADADLTGSAKGTAKLEGNGADNSLLLTMDPDDSVTLAPVFIDKNAQPITPANGNQVTWTLSDDTDLILLPAPALMDGKGLTASLSGKNTNGTATLNVKYTGVTPNLETTITVNVGTQVTVGSIQVHDHNDADKSSGSITLGATTSTNIKAALFDDDSTPALITNNGPYNSVTWSLSQVKDSSSVDVAEADYDTILTLSKASGKEITIDAAAMGSARITATYTAPDATTKTAYVDVTINAAPALTSVAIQKADGTAIGSGLPEGETLNIKAVLLDQYNNVWADAAANADAKFTWTLTELDTTDSPVGTPDSVATLLPTTPSQTATLTAVGEGKAVINISYDTGSTPLTDSVTIPITAAPALDEVVLQNNDGTDFGATKTILPSATFNIKAVLLDQYGDPWTNDTDNTGTNFAWTIAETDLADSIVSAGTVGSLTETTGTTNTFTATATEGKATITMTHTDSGNVTKTDNVVVTVKLLDPEKMTLKQSGTEVSGPDTTGVTFANTDSAQTFNVEFLVDDDGTDTATNVSQKFTVTEDSTPDAAFTYSFDATAGTITITPVAAGGPFNLTIKSVYAPSVTVTLKVTIS